MCTSVLAVTRVQLDVSIPGPLVFEQAGAELTAEWHLVRVRLPKRGNLGDGLAA